MQEVNPVGKWPVGLLGRLRLPRLARAARSAFTFCEVFIGGAYRGWSAAALTNQILSVCKGRAIGIEVIRVSAFGDVDHNVLDWWLVEAEGALCTGRVGVLAGVIFSWHGAIPP